MAVAIVVGRGDVFAGARLAAEGGPEVGAIFVVVLLVDVGGAAGGLAAMDGGEEAADVAVGIGVFGVIAVEDEMGEAAGVALHHDGDDADALW